MYFIETPRRNTTGDWLELGHYTGHSLDAVKNIAQDFTEELSREVRVVSYRPRFQLHAEFSASGQPLR